MNPDFLDFLRSLLRAGARFLVVGAHAMAIYGVPRATGDLDIWISPDRENAGKVLTALEEFGAPLGALGISRSDLESADRIIQFGTPPRRLDLLTRLSGIDFESAWTRRRLHSTGGLEIPFVSREDLIANKQATGRSKDQVDLELLRRQRPS